MSENDFSDHYAILPCARGCEGKSGSQDRLLTLCLLCARYGQKIGAIYGQRVSEEWCGQKKGCFYGHLSFPDLG